jgi:hypothetical protein
VKTKVRVLGLIAAIGGVAAGIHYRIPIVIVLVCLGLAVFSAVVGIRMLVTRKAEIPTSDSFQSYKEYHTGLSAQFWGVLYLMFSVPLAAFGVMVWRYGGEPPAEILERMIRSPLASGLVIMSVGVGIVLHGLTRVLPGNAAFVETRIGPFERTIAAIYGCVVGGLVTLAGLVRALSPGTLTRLRDAAIAWVLELAKSS